MEIRDTDRIRISYSRERFQMHFCNSNGFTIMYKLYHFTRLLCKAIKCVLDGNKVRKLNG